MLHYLPSFNLALVLSNLDHVEANPARVLKVGTHNPLTMNALAHRTRDVRMYVLRRSPVLHRAARLHDFELSSNLGMAAS